MLSYNINTSLSWLFIENAFFYWSWSIVALYCCFSFCYTANWISHMYTYISSFLDILPIYVSAEHKMESSVLYSRFSLVSILYIVVYICQSQSPSSLHPSSYLSALTKKWEKTQITKIRNERREITTDLKELNKVIR